MTPILQAIKVAIMVVPTISVGLAEPPAVRKAMTVVGMRVILEVLTAKKVHISSLAVCGSGFTVKL